MTQTTSVPLEEITDALLGYAEEHRAPQALWFANWLHEQFRDRAYKPHRDDDVAAWLKRMRDQYQGGWPSGVTLEQRACYEAINEMLNRYRECADYGLTLRPEDDKHGDP